MMTSPELRKWRLAIVKELQRGQDGFGRSAGIQSLNNITVIYNSQLIDDNTQDSHFSTIEGLLTSTCAHRATASKARSLMTEWSKILRAPEDVKD